MTDASAFSYSRLTALSAQELAGILGQGPEEAARLAEAAAKQGVIEAQLVWAQMLLEGRGTARDPAAAFRWFRAAGESGEPHALNMLGRCHERGWGTGVDYAEAARLFSEAADKGHDWAQFNLASLLMSGPGRDDRRALSLYVRAARQGLGKAMTVIGQFREQGRGVRAKPRAALRWYERGAARGDFRAHDALARIALEKRDIAAALVHLEAAIAGAFPDFCRQLGERLLAHPDEAVRALGCRALTRAEEAVEDFLELPKPRPRRCIWKRIFRGCR